MHSSSRSTSCLPMSSWCALWVLPERFLLSLTYPCLDNADQTSNTKNADRLDNREFPNTIHSLSSDMPGCRR